MFNKVLKYLWTKWFGKKIAQVCLGATMDDIHNATCSKLLWCDGMQHAECFF